jgi:ABC-type glutathione transport system ATPase component
VERPVTAGRVVAEPAVDERDVTPLLEVTDLRVRFTRAGRAVHAVNGLSYRLAPGRMLAIIGESGSGKSVSSRALMGLLPPTAQVSGSARFDGTELVGLPEREMRRRRGADIAMVFQDPARSLNPTMRVGAQITEAIRAHAQLDKAAAKERAIELLQLVRLPAPERRFHEYPHQLSGGMRQRVAIARTLILNPRIILMDEPFGALDPATRLRMQDLLVSLSREAQATVFFVTHSIEEAVYLGDRTYVFSSCPGTILKELAVPPPDFPAKEMQRQPAFMEIVFQIRDMIESLESSTRAGDE